MSNSETLTRKELYDLVWSTPLLTLSKKYWLSDNGLRKICIRLQIPLPPAGHWMRLQFNKKVERPPLSGNYTGDATVTLQLRPEGEPVVSVNPAKAIAASLRNDKSISFDVPERLNSKHPLIQAAKESLTKKGRYDNHGVVNCHFGELNIKVGIESISRMLRFADTLLSVLIKRGHHVEVSSSDTFACINGQRLKILFRERLKKHVVEGKYYNNTELHPTGILVFRLDGYLGKEWKDGKEKLEYYLPDIVATLEITSEQENRRDEERRKEHLEWERQEQIKKDLQARKEKDLSEFKRTLVKAKRWHKAVNLRSYIDEVEQKGIASGDWLSWARQKADWYDPFIEATDEMLNEIDRDTLVPIRKGSYDY